MVVMGKVNPGLQISAGAVSACTAATVVVEAVVW
jgi:hypothetical protein